MAVPLLTGTVEKHEALFVFLWSVCVKPSEIYRRTQVNSADSCLGQWRVYGWLEIFQNGRQNVTDEHRTGRVVSVATETVKQQTVTSVYLTNASLQNTFCL